MKVPALKMTNRLPGFDVRTLKRQSGDWMHWSGLVEIHRGLQYTIVVRQFGTIGTDEWEPGNEFRALCIEYLVLASHALGRGHEMVSPWNSTPLLYCTMLHFR